MPSDYEAVKALLQNVTNSNNIRVSAHKSEMLPPRES
jgi:hypothetical protein